MAQRQSNIELFRIIVMMLIVCHHYVVNSGLFPLIQAHPSAPQSLFLSLFGMWGKTGINCFVLISGYFMCRSQITLRKFLKLLLQIEFYNLLLFVVFTVSGYAPFTLKGLGFALLPVRDVNSDFTSAFLLYYLFIPFINTLVTHLSRTAHGILTGLCLLLFCIGARVDTGFHIQSNYLTWFIILHLIASYIRFYGLLRDGDARFWGILALCTVLASAASVWLALRNGLAPYRFVEDANAPLALATAVCAFMFFKGLKMPDREWINGIAAGTFGVLLIHANSDTMRHWLWKDTLHNISYFDRPWFHAILSVLAVFSVCIFADWLRRRFLEPPVLAWTDRKVLPKIQTWTNK